MSTWLAHQHVAVLFVVLAAAFALLAVVAHLGLSRHLAGREADASHLAGPLMSALGGAFAVLAAFTIASAATDLRQVEYNVAQEANAVARLSWAVNALGPTAPATRDALAAYVASTVQEEWRYLDGAEVQQTEAFTRLSEVERTVRSALAKAGPSLGPAERTEVLGALDATAGARRSRFVSAHPLQPALLAMLLLTGAALVIDAVVLSLASHRRALVVLGGLVFVVPASVALVLSLSAPFSGSFAASKGPLVSVLDGLRAGSFTLALG